MGWLLGARKSRPRRLPARHEGWGEVSGGVGVGAVLAGLTYGWSKGGSDREVLLVWRCVCVCGWVGGFRGVVRVVECVRWLLVRVSCKARAGCSPQENRARIGCLRATFAWGYRVGELTTAPTIIKA